MNLFISYLKCSQILELEKSNIKFIGNVDEVSTVFEKGLQKSHFALDVLVIKKLGQIECFANKCVRHLLFIFLYYESDHSNDNNMESSGKVTTSCTGKFILSRQISAKVCW